MADNNKNPRRTIWLSETEPLSHYDIWLSKNQHLNSDGEPVVDSGVLRDCDYIFKVWDCDNWHPIVGLNSTALNKINTVLNTVYTTTHDSHNISSSSYLEFHLPLFTKPTSSPSELFDAGTIGLAILEYVTEEEWKSIFEGDAFSYAFKWYIEEGDTNIDLLIDPAEADKLGGIYADEFEIGDIFPDSITVPSIYEINASYDWLALAKYKLGYKTGTPEDYNLYVNAKDIISAINAYTISNPSAPALSIPWATTETCGGILADVHRDSPNQAREAGVWVRYVPLNTLLYDVSYSGLSIPEHHLAITGELLIKAINEEYTNHPDTPGITIDTNDLTEAIKNIFKDTQSIGWNILSEGANPSVSPNVWGANVSLNAGRFLRIKLPYPELEPGTNWDLSHNAIDWFSIVGGLGISIVEDQNMGTMTISATNQGTDTWRPILINNTPIEDNYLNIVAGLNITITPTTNDNITTATISASSAPSPITIAGGEGIDVTTTLSGYEVGIRLTGASLGKVLSYDGSNVVWANPQAGSYTAGTGVLINLLSSTISSEILIDSNNYTASNTATFNCIWGDLNTTSGIKMALDGSDTKILEPFTYTKLTWNKVNSGSISFNVGDGNHNLKIYMKGDPVFIELDLSDASNQIISLNFNNGHYIDVNGAILNGYFNGSYFLITVQFGIVKIELMN